MMRRIISVLAVMALVGALMVVTAVPALANNKEPKYNSHFSFNNVFSESGNYNYHTNYNSHSNP